MTVLILAGEFDVSADQMILALQNRNVPVCRADTMWFPKQLSLQACAIGYRGPVRSVRPGHPDH